MKRKISCKRLSIFLVVVMVLLMSPFAANAEDVSSVAIDGGITVFEAEAKYTVGDGVDVLFGCTKGGESFDVLAVNKATGVLQFENAAGEYKALCDKDGNLIVLDQEKASNVAVIYNDVKGTVRYVANGALAYYEVGEAYAEANDIPVSSEFVFASGNETITHSESLLTNVQIYNAHSSGTAEIVGFQAHTANKSIRFVAGVDMLWYTSVGYDVEVYADGVCQEIKSFEETRVFSGVIADGEYVYASTYGYKYFSVFTITDIDVSDGREYYVIVKPYTTFGEAKYYGTAKKVNIGDNEYTFDESYSEDETIVDPTIVIDDVKGAVGDEITVTVDLLNSPELYAMSLKIAFDDTALTLLSAESGEAMGAFTYTSPSRLKNGANFIWYANDPATANGTVLELVFKINDVAEIGNYAITMTCDPNNTYDADDNDVNLAFVNGSIAVAGAEVVAKYTVKFVDHDGTLIKSETVESGKSATAPADPKRDGYVFSGWDKKFDNVTSDLTINATYAEVAEPTIVIGNATGCAGDEVTITFDLLNSPELYAMSLKITFDDTALKLISTASGEAMNAFTYTKPSRLKSGANFVWYANDPATANGTVLELVFRINDDAEIGDYTITMTCDPSNTYDADDNDVNLMFVNGSINVEGGAETVPQYTVTFVDFDGTLIKTETVESGKSATAPINPKRNGYVFVGWDKSFDSITSDLIITATYTKITEPTIVIGNATGSMGDEVVVTFDLLNSPELYAMSLKITFDDTALTLISTESGEAMDAFTYTKPSRLKNGANFVWYANDPATANGTVLKLVFRINDVVADSYSITMTCDPSNTYDADDNDVNLDFVNGSITVIQ